MKKCPTGKYYCTLRKKCMPIPRGYHVGRAGWLEKDDDEGKKNGKKNGSNGNGHSNGSSGNGNGSGSNGGNGNGGGNGGGGVSEATTILRKNGQTMWVTFQWRGKYMSLQMFFPQLKVPKKQEVQDAIVKVYPNSRVMNYYVTERDPSKPLLQLPD